MELYFIGNSRGIARNCVMWAIEEDLPLRMWGSGWNSILKDHMDLFESPFITNAALPDLYRSARVTLNDHWEDMLNKQFINNRIFDSLACGLPVISDEFEELRQLFPDSILYYKNRNDFKNCIHRLNTDYKQIQENVLKQQELIRKEYSFETRAKQLTEIVCQYKAARD